MQDEEKLSLDEAPRAYKVTDKRGRHQEDENEPTDITTVATEVGAPVEDETKLKTRVLKKSDIGAGDLVVVWSKNLNHQGLRIIRSKIHRANKKWDGVMLHLLPGETIGAMKLPHVQALYEAIMSRFDPDLFEIRMRRKQAAVDEVEAKKAAQNNATAEQIADRLEQVAKSAQREKDAEILKSVAQLELAAKEK